MGFVLLSLIFVSCADWKSTKCLEDSAVNTPSVTGLTAPRHLPPHNKDCQSAVRSASSSGEKLTFGVLLKLLYPFTALVLLLAACGEPVQSKPSAPSTVLALSGTAFTSVTWQDKSKNEDAFVIYRDTLSDTNITAQSLVKIAEVTSNSSRFEDKTVASGARYIYYVAAKNTLGDSESVRQAGEAVRMRPAFEVVVGGATSSDWRFPGVLTAYLLLVNEDSAKPQSNVTVTVTGPAGWNNNNPHVFTSYVTEFGRDVVRVAPTTPLVSGTYQVIAVVNGQEYKTESVVSSEAVLEVSSVDFTLNGNVANSNWTSVTGATSYRSFLGASDINVKGERTLSLSSEFSNLNLGPAEYTGRVYALNYDATATQIQRPFPQFMVSVSESDFTLVEFTGSTPFTVDPTGRYLASDDNDKGKPATALSLADLGAVPGECVGLMRAGDFQADSSRPDASPDMIGVFRNGASFLNPGALGNQSSEYTSLTAQGKPTDIAEDFLVPGRKIIVQIPDGATGLSLSADDVRNSDNSDLDKDFGVLVAKVSCPGGTQLQGYTLNYLK
jgi:hypothetical protein